MEADTLGALVTLSDTLSVTIHDAWTGYDDHSPITATWALLRMSRGVFAGTGRFATALGGERQVDVRLSAGSAQAFLEALARAPLCREPEGLTVTGTDSYSQVEVVLHVAQKEMGRTGGHVLLFSKSTGEGGAPWGVFFAGKLRWSDSPAIGQALRALHRPLQRSVLTKMLKGT
jgi:hypothetical protein